MQLLQRFVVGGMFCQMALKRLHTEVDKTVREVRACLDTYDERWQELLEFNRQFVQRKEHLVDEARKEVIRGKLLVTLGVAISFCS